VPQVNGGLFQAGDCHGTQGDSEYDGRNLSNHSALACNSITVTPPAACFEKVQTGLPPPSMCADHLLISLHNRHRPGDLVHWKVRHSYVTQSVSAARVPRCLIACQRADMAATTDLLLTICRFRLILHKKAKLPSFIPQPFETPILENDKEVCWHGFTYNVRRKLFLLILASMSSRAGYIYLQVVHRHSNSSRLRRLPPCHIMCLFRNRAGLPARFAQDQRHRRPPGPHWHPWVGPAVHAGAPQLRGPVARHEAEVVGLTIQCGLSI
jgi:hypothetical protein